MQIFLDVGVLSHPARMPPALWRQGCPLCHWTGLWRPAWLTMRCQRLLENLEVDRDTRSASLEDLLCEAALQKAWRLVEQVVHSCGRCLGG
jgi:hypothetical protein